LAASFAIREGFFNSLLGIGGSFGMVALLAKNALLREIGSTTTGVAFFSGRATTASGEGKVHVG
jgi:hypothetical protein